MKDLIVNQSEWIPIGKIPGRKSVAKGEFVREYGNANGEIPGCYQIALTKDIDDIGDDYVHKMIGYNGMSKDVINRTGDVRAPNGNHGAGRYITNKGLCRDTQVVVRYLITESEDKSTELENKLHAEFEQSFGYRFGWKEASGGVDGKMDLLISTLDYLTSEQCIEAARLCSELGKTKAVEEFEEKLEKTLYNDE
tara:strand:+ start:2450 stop:3034 length:585 start_codon:yes stop_codon:yes gene_type:complete